ncbi:MAG: glycosyltransferase [Patescibacteria group bacterium]|nr:MAG: glycosyltransferase [Patescibacteria group bacterium]
MKVLLVHKFNFIEGGAGRYFLELAEALEKRGVKTAKFCCQHPNNLPDKNEKYFTKAYDYFGALTWREKIRAALKLLYNFEAKKDFEALLKEFKPDIIHIHNIYHQISPSILTVAAKYKIPVVMHLHDYKLVSPNYKMYDRYGLNERALGKNYLTCLWDRCFNDSFWLSALVAIEMYLHHSFLNIYKKNIKGYIAPSEFMRDMVVRGGVLKEKVLVEPYFISRLEEWKPVYDPGEYLLYFGRLAVEKGLDVLIKAMSKVKYGLVLKIVGQGSEEAKLRQMVKELNLQDRVEFVGRLDGEELFDCIRKSYAVVVPSVWYENKPLALSEAMALGKTAIVSKIGGMPEVVKDKINGRTFIPGDENDLARVINELNNHDIINYGQRARETSEAFSVDKHCEKLLSYYNLFLN